MRRRAVEPVELVRVRPARALRAGADAPPGRRDPTPTTSSRRRRAPRARSPPEPRPPPATAPHRDGRSRRCAGLANRDQLGAALRRHAAGDCDPSRGTIRTRPRERSGHIGANRRRAAGGRRLEDLRHRLKRRVAAERPSAGQHLVDAARRTRTHPTARRPRDLAPARATCRRTEPSTAPAPVGSATVNVAASPRPVRRAASRCRSRAASRARRR